MIMAAESKAREEAQNANAGGCCSVGSFVGPGVEVNERQVSRAAWRIGIAVVIAGQMMMLGLGVNLTPPEFGTTTYWVLHFLLFGCVLIVVGLLGCPLVKEMGKSILERRISVEGLFILSVLGALAGSLICTMTGTGNVYYEVVAIVLVIYTIGKTLEVRSREKAIKESNKVKDAFNYAYVLNDRGEREKRSLEQIGCCCQVLVGAGESIAVDGFILSGEGFVKDTVMTGELEPVAKKEGDFILAGSYSIDGTFTIRPTGLKGNRKLDALINTVEGARLAPSALQEQANQLMKRFLPLVVAVSLGAFVFWFVRSTWQQALFNSMAVLLVACPCALGLATPLAVWRGLWKLSTMGLISRSGEFLDLLARADRVVFDKTGTLSEGHLTVVDIIVREGVEAEDIKDLVSSIECRVGHPVAKALSQMKRRGEAKYIIQSVKEIPAKGVEAWVRGRDGGNKILVKIGERALMEGHKGWKEMQDLIARYGGKKQVFISIDERIAGFVCCDEKLRKGTEETFRELSKLGLKGIILTGDTTRRWTEIAGIGVESEMSPDEKVERVKQYEREGEWVIFVGDGVNDASAMAVSRASIAMRGGSELTQSTASAVLMGSTLEVLPDAIRLCRLIRKNVRGSIFFAAVYNCVGMSLAAIGLLHPVVAALLMLVSSSWVSIRAIRSI